MIGHIKISKDQFYRLGGFSNPDLFRKEINGSWAHFKRSK